MENQGKTIILEKKLRRLTRIVIIVGLGWLMSLTVGLFAFLSIRNNPPTPDVLRVRGLVVVDEKGTDRIWIGAPVPDPSILGWRHPRGEMSGIILLDEEGNERSGYVTTNGYANVMLTLDSIAKQHVLFMAEPHGSPTLWMWGDSRKDDFQVSVDSQAPRLRLTQKGKAIFRIPDSKEVSK